MSFIGNKILLGYEDEQITDKHKAFVDFKTNKIGGKPDWMNQTGLVNCRLCGQVSPLILQIYAPMKNSLYHRTLYIFACIQPNCWNKNESWTCLRTQTLDTPYKEKNVSLKNESKSETASFWCNDSENWGDDDQDENLDYFNDFAENKVDLSSFANNVNEINVGISQMNVGSNSTDTTAPQRAIAMIEGNEVEVCVDTPIVPTNDLSTLLHQPVNMPLMPDSPHEFTPFFVSVDEEDLSRVGISEEDVILSKIRAYRATESGQDDLMISDSAENYEKSAPAHGDKMFHRFLTRINANPGQIIRYGGYPLWLYPAEQSQSQCQYCRGESAFEMQILPTLIPKLYIGGSSGHLEFGSVFIYSCLVGCWDPHQLQPREECVIVQQEKT